MLFYNIYPEIWHNLSLTLKSVYDNIFFDKSTFNKKMSNINDINNPLVKKLINFLNADKERAILSPK